MIKSSYIILFWVFISCAAQTNTEKPYTARNDIRFGKRFFSLFIRDDGTAYVIKGIGTYYTEPLQVESADTSAVFSLDSSNVYFKQLDKLKNLSIIDSNRSDAPRVEIYYREQKVYDSYRWGANLWDVFRPIAEQLPTGFNPFRLNEKPFG